LATYEDRTSTVFKQQSVERKIGTMTSKLSGGEDLGVVYDITRFEPDRWWRVAYVDQYKGLAVERGNEAYCRFKLEILGGQKDCIAAFVLQPDCQVAQFSFFVS
jgi:hypothetical protein